LNVERTIKRRNEVVRFIGKELPAPTRIDNTTDPEVCGRGHTLEEIVVSAEDRGVQHAIIAIGKQPAEMAHREDSIPYRDSEERAMNPTSETTIRVSWYSSPRGP